MKIEFCSEVLALYSRERMFLDKLRIGSTNAVQIMEPLMRICKLIGSSSRATKLLQVLAFIYEDVCGAGRDV